MKRATITLPDDLDAEVEAYLAEQAAPPSLTALVQAALRRFLGERRFDPENLKPRARPPRFGAQPSEVAEAPAVYEVGGGLGPPLPLGAAPWSRAGSAGPRLAELPALLASLPRLSESEADELAKDLDRAREELAGTELTDPWDRAPVGGGAARGGA